MKSDRYVLDKNKRVIPCPDLETWAIWFEKGEWRVVAKTEMRPGYMVSTVFLALDHSFGHGPPVLWETMIFAGPDHDDTGKCWRCPGTWEQAEAQHARVIALYDHESDRLLEPGKPERDT